MSLRLTCSSFVLAALCAPAVALQELPEGISLPEDRALATKLSDAQAYLADQRWEAAVGLLQEVADADPSALIHDRDAIYVGAVERAQLLLRTLPEPAVAFRQELVGRRAALELAEALDPPDVHRLESIARRYAGVEVGERARKVLQELWYDRGYPELARRQGATELRPDWQAALPPQPPADPLMPPVFRDLDDVSLPRLRPQELQSAWRFSFDDDAPTSDLGHRMAFGHGLGFATNGREVVALELGSGQSRWHFRGPEGWSRLGSRERQDISKGASPLTLLAPVLAEGVVLAVIQEPLSIGRSDSYSRIPIRRKLPARRLYAFDAVDGTILWKQEASWMEPGQRFPVQLAAGPPAVAGGRVFLPVYSASGTVDLSLLAFDLHTGERLWERFLVSGTMETNLFGNVLSELACPPPVADLERVLLCTHFGAVCAVDASTGNALWTRTYPRTLVRTRQNGMVGNRDLFFHNNPPTFDGERLVVAPTDSFFAFCLDVLTGDRIARWPAVSNNRYGTLSNLIGMDKDYVWFSGTHVSRLPLDEIAHPRPRTSPSLYDYVSSDSANLNAGAVAHGSVLAMSTGGVVDLDPEALSIRGDALSWETLEGRFIGPAQVTHGLVLLMTSKGIIAFASPGALLDTMISRDLDAELLREILPLLEAVRYEEEPGLGRKIARSAEDLAKREEFADLAEDLDFLAGRTLLLSGATRRGLKQLSTLLDSSQSRLRIDAASLILDAQAELDASSGRLTKALAVLEDDRPQRVLTRSNRMESLEGALVRARALIALTSRDQAVQRQGLVDALLLEDPSSLEVGGIPLQDWAEEILFGLLRDPKQAAAHQVAAASRLAQAAPDDAFLRAYGNTDAAQDWLQERLALDGLAPEHRIRLLAWAYRYGTPDRTWPWLPKKLQHKPSLAALPGSLQPLVSVKLDGAVPLHAMAVDDVAYVFLQDDHLCRILRLTADGSRLLHTVPFLTSADSLPNLEQYRFATETGIALLYKDRWVHIDHQGRRRERLLPFPMFKSSAPKRIGDFAAVLLRGTGRSLVLQMIDLESGLPYLEQQLEATADRYLQIVANSEYLFLLQDKSSHVSRIDLQHAGDIVDFQLPFAPRWGELQSVRAFGDGVAIPTSRAAADGSILIQRPNRPTQVFPLEDLEFTTIPTAEGIGWWTRPTRSIAAEAGPITLHWMQPGARRPWTHRFLDPAVRIPQFLSRMRNLKALDGEQFLAIQPAARDRLEVQCLALGELETNWTSLVNDISFSNLVEPIPVPQHGADGWALLLREASTRRANAQLHCLIFDDKGILRGQYSTGSTARSFSTQRIHLLPGWVLLRNGDVITLLGDQ
ncbi:MAG: outer membrane protein assembly factor BamB family protein [Planctomycetota bacterium]